MFTGKSSLSLLIRGTKKRPWMNESCTGAPEIQARYHPDSAARGSPQRLMPGPFTEPTRRRLLFRRRAGFACEAQGGDIARPSAGSHRPPALLKTTCAMIPVIAFVMQIVLQAPASGTERRNLQSFVGNATGSKPVSYADYCIQCRQKSQAVSRICAFIGRISRRRRPSSRSPSSGRRSARR